MATTQPLRNASEIDAVRTLLKTSRDRCLFDLGINTAFRGGDLLSISVGQALEAVEHKGLFIREQKTSKARRSDLNGRCVVALKALIGERLAQGASNDDSLFVGNKGTRLTIGSLGRMWKDWCKAGGLDGVYASHSARKTKAYIMRTEHKMPIEVLCKVLNHSSPAVTMRYICVQDDEVKPFYRLEL